MSDCDPYAPSPRRIGLLHAGEMGAAVAAVLRSRGIEVLGCAEGRSDATVARCVAAGITLCPSVRQLVAESDWVLSLVPPDAAESLCAQFCELESPDHSIFVDFNSISPERAARLGNAVEARRRRFVDGSINGLAKNLCTTATMFLSGRDAKQVGSLFSRDVRVQLLGENPGSASAMKMLLGGVSKGICALLVELLRVADQLAMREAFLAALSRIYPEVAALGERMLPSYAHHADRRMVETGELQDTAIATGIVGPSIAAIANTHRELAEHLSRHATDASSLCTLLNHLAATKFLLRPSIGVPESKVNLEGSYG